MYRIFQIVLKNLVNELSVVPFKHLGKNLSLQIEIEGLAHVF